MADESGGGMNPKKQWRRFLNHVASAPIGSRMELGLMYDDDNGWRVYHRIGEGGLAMTPAQARSIAMTAEKQSRMPEFSAIDADFKKMLVEDTRALADEAEENNRQKIKPPAYSTAAGHA
jgi:hypothetical protein